MRIRLNIRYGIDSANIVFLMHAPTAKQIPNNNEIERSPW